MEALRTCWRTDQLNSCDPFGGQVCRNLLGMSKEAPTFYHGATEEESDARVAWIFRRRCIVGQEHFVIKNTLTKRLLLQSCLFQLPRTSICPLALDLSDFWKELGTCRRPVDPCFWCFSQEITAPASPESRGNHESNGQKSEAARFVAAYLAKGARKLQGKTLIRGKGKVL